MNLVSCCLCHGGVTFCLSICQCVSIFPSVCIFVRVSLDYVILIQVFNFSDDLPLSAPVCACEWVYHCVYVSVHLYICVSIASSRLCVWASMRLCVCASARVCVCASASHVVIHLNRPGIKLDTGHAYLLVVYIHFCFCQSILLSVLVFGCNPTCLSVCQCMWLCPILCLVKER